jgi:phytanoyl-CoA hydroxylase
VLSGSQLTSFEQNGYLSLAALLGDDEIEALGAAVDDIVRRAGDGDEVSRHCDFTKGPEPRVRKIKRGGLQSDVFQRVRRHPEILSVVRDVLGPNVYCARYKINLKLPGGGEFFDWHQDWAYCPYTNDDLIHLGVAIDDMSSENGGIVVIPGTHRTPLYNHRDNGNFVGRVDEAQIPIERAVALEAPAGSIFFFHIRTLHASAANTSARPRRLFLLEYAAGDAWPLLGISSWESLEAAFVLGSPTPTPRVSDVPKVLPLPGLRGNLQKI